MTWSCGTMARSGSSRRMAAAPGAQEPRRCHVSGRSSPLEPRWLLQWTYPGWSVRRKSGSTGSSSLRRPRERAEQGVQAGGCLLRQPPGFVEARIDLLLQPRYTSCRRMSFPRRRVLFAAALWMCAAAGIQQAASPPQSSEVRLKADTTTAQAEVRLKPDATGAPELHRTGGNATVKQYCAGCHNERLKSEATATGVILDRADVARAAEHPEMWEKVVRRLRTGSMPPRRHTPAGRGHDPRAPPRTWKARSIARQPRRQIRDGTRCTD